MSQGLCPSCGAAVNLAAEQGEINCTYCGTLVQRPEAEAQFTQFSEVKKNKFGGALLLAEMAEEVGKYNEALNYYNKVIEQQPDFSEVWLKRGVCLVLAFIDMSAFEEIIPIYKESINSWSQAISSWKTAIKFAKDAVAMKKRVALEINNVLTQCYRVHDDDPDESYLDLKFIEESISLRIVNFFGSWSRL